MLKKLISIFIIVAIMASFSGCELIKRHKHDPPTPDTDVNNGGENGEDNEEEGEETVYVYSVLSKSIHLQGCYHVNEIKDDYKKEISGDVSALLEKGYTLCKDCFPPAVDPEPEEPEAPGVSKEEATFLINKSSHKIHMLDCYHIAEMAEANIEYTDLTLEELLEADNIPCATCLPEQWEKYKEEHPELNSDK